MLRNNDSYLVSYTPLYRSSVANLGSPPKVLGDARSDGDVI